MGILRDLSAARQIERMKSDFVSLVSHELRTPLSLIKGYASTVLRPGLAIAPDTQDRFLQGISGATDRLAQIINNLLNASRIESGLFVPRLAVASLRAFIEPVVQDLQPQAVGRIALIWDGEPPNVRVDAEQMRLVISNIIGNAIRYAIPHTEHPIVLTVRAVDDGTTILVSDS
ncbi:MAG: histidine kinase, partial [Actinobacteria bacterium]|nr:histidine kinase [Actinomycetota bacterium]